MGYRCAVRVQYGSGVAIGRRPFIAVSTIVVIISIGVTIFSWLWPLGAKSANNELGVTSGEVNLRTCPAISCESSRILGTGRQVVILAEVPGEVVNGSNIWYQVEFGTETRFAHSNFVYNGNQLNWGTFEAFVAPAAVIVSVAVAAAMRSRRLKALLVAAGKASSVDTVLYTCVIAVGIMTSSIGFLAARLAGTPAVSFFSDALTNLGLGLIAAAIVFGLFQALLSGRNVSQQQIEELAKSLHTIHLELQEIRQNQKMDSVAPNKDLKSAQTRCHLVRVIHLALTKIRSR